jgi:uncharacterized protein
MIHPHTRLGFVSEEIGCGVFATQLIPKGTITWVLDDLDLRLNESYVNSLDSLRREKVIKHAFRDRNGQYILCWDIAQFINHSFTANCVPTAYYFEIAGRDIYPGEQLTDDYGCFNLDRPFDCLPEEGTKRTQVMPDDVLNCYQEWDRQASEAMHYFNQVEQPLKYLIEKKYVDKVDAVAEGRELMDSTSIYYYDRSKQLNPNLS